MMLEQHLNIENDEWQTEAKKDFQNKFEIK